MEWLREQEINEIKNGTKIKLNMLNDEIDDILKNLEFKLKHGTLKNRYFKKLRLGIPPTQIDKIKNSVFSS